MESFSADSFSGDFSSGKNRSFWLSTISPLKYQKLDSDIETGVLVIGGGISGFTTAYCLIQSGYQVVLVEDGYLGSGETGRTTAHLSFALDDHYFELAKIFNDVTARLVGESHIAAVNFIRLPCSRLKVHSNGKSNQWSCHL